jgi:hypothetical protein
MADQNRMEVEGADGMAEAYQGEAYQEEQAPREEEPVIKFRNYMPKTPSLLKGVQTRVTTEKIEKEIDGILDRNQRDLEAKEWMSKVT